MSEYNLDEDGIRQQNQWADYRDQLQQEYDALRGELDELKEWVDNAAVTLAELRLENETRASDVADVVEKMRRMAKTERAYDRDAVAKVYDDWADRLDGKDAEGNHE